MTRLLLFVGFAGAVAIALAIVMHGELELPPALIRSTALLCSGILAIALYSDRFGGRK